MELRRQIGKLTNAHPCLTPHEAFLAIAETAGDLQFATQLLNQEPDFATLSRHGPQHGCGARGG